MKRSRPLVSARLLPSLCVLALALAAILTPARVAWADVTVTSSTTYEEFTDAVKNTGGGTISFNEDYTLKEEFGYIEVANNTNGATVTIDLQGHTLYMPGASYFVVKKDVTLVIKNGKIVASNRKEYLFEVNEGILTIDSVEEQGDNKPINSISDAAVSGAVIYASNNSTITLSGTTSLKNNFAGNRGGAIYTTGGTLTLKDQVTISNNSASNAGGGIYAEKTAVIIEAGTISGNHSYSNDWGNGGGGGLCIGPGDDGTLLIKGGTIANNVSEGGGGGIFFGGTTFTMTGGTVDGNIAKLHEGGGISIMRGMARFDGGTITNNYSGYNDDAGHTAVTDYADWGGGGIFISDQGAVAIFPKTTLVTNNTAGGFGGGLAACSTGRTYVMGTIGIYDNKADGTNVSGSGSAKREDHTYAYDSEVFMANGYQDYFSALYSYVNNAMPGGSENWTGSADGVPVSSPETDPIIATSVCGLTAHPTGAVSGAQFIVSNNHSYTHGGGILNNGTVIYGEETPDYKIDIFIGKALAIYANKLLIDNNNTDVNILALLTDAGGASRCAFEVVDSAGTVVSLGKVVLNQEANEEPTAFISFDRRLIFDKAGTYTYIVREKAAISSWMQTDSNTQYRIKVVVKEKSDGEHTIPNLADTTHSSTTIRKTYLYIESYTIERSVDAGAIWSSFDDVYPPGLGDWEHGEKTRHLDDEAHAARLQLTSAEVLYTFTNSASTTRSITITKVWDDEGNADGSRLTAEEFAGMLTLTADGEVVAGAKPTVTLADANTYTVTYTDLPLYTVSEDGDGNKVGTEIAYAITEAAPEGYTATYSNTDASVTDYVIDGGTITNAHVPSIPEPATPSATVAPAPPKGAIPATGDEGAPVGVIGGLAALGPALICAASIRLRREQE